MLVLVANSSLVGVLSGCRNAGSTQTECLILATEKGVGRLLQPDPNSDSEPHPFQDGDLYSLSRSAWAEVCVGCPGDVSIQGWEHVCNIHPGLPDPWEAAVRLLQV